MSGDSDPQLRAEFERLAARFAPVLRWEHRERGSTATLGQWWLEASGESWMVGVDSSGWVTPVKGSRGPTSRENNCRAAETALRGLGVMFKTEDGE